MNPAITCKGLRYGFVREDRYIFSQRSRVVIDWEESKLGAGQFSQFVVGYASETAFGVLHDNDGINPEYLAGQSKAAKNILRHTSPGIANDVCLAQMKAQDGKHINSGVHAGDDRQTAAGTRVGDVGPGCGIALVGGKQELDLGHRPRR